MRNTINMQDMRYLNLFSRVTQVSTKYCFKYNEAIIFCVPRSMMRKAIGDNAKNVRRLNEILRKKIKIIAVPQSIKDAKKFIEAIVSPVGFKDIEIKDNELILNAGSQNKAALIGRHKRRFLEMQKIIDNYFGKEFRIV